MRNKPTKKDSIVPVQQIQTMIFTIRGSQVMVDRDLATVYDVGTKVLNQAVKRNIERFPQEFRFQLTETETKELVTNCDRFKSLKHSTSNPYVFTEQGISMLSAVLRSETAIKISIKIISAFVEMRHFIQQNASVFARLDHVERRQIAFESETEKKFEKVFQSLEATDPPRQGIFYKGQVYDAYAFVAELIRKANNSLILIDNYVDDTVPFRPYHAKSAPIFSSQPCLAHHSQVPQKGVLAQIHNKPGKLDKMAF
ncbi:ORF6N domain-containing protein [Desulfoplanes sp. PS50]